jgi:acetolactate decarboxylase
MKIIIYLLVLALPFSWVGCSGSPREDDTLFQISTINALLGGDYEGTMTFGELKKHGTFGLGTFDALDGEMIGLEGRFYQIKTDGVAYVVSDSTTTPFAVVTVFDADKTLPSQHGMDYEGLQNYLDEAIPDKSIFYAIKIKGAFQYIKTRSVPKQQEPYPPLVEVVKEQTMFEFHDVTGTIVGFRSPDSVKGGINVPGYHLHFITEDRTASGHLLACRLQDATIALDYTSEFYMVLPQHMGTRSKTPSTRDRSEELKKVEQD